MYAVVGCGECGALWVVADRPETTGCPRCGKRHRFRKLRKFAETEAEDDARQARAALLAERRGETEAFSELDSFAAMADRIDEAAVSDEAYLAGQGIDPEAVADAAERGRDRGGSSRRETVISALRDLDEPTEAAVVDYATDRGVPADSAREALSKLLCAGEVTESDGRYRRL